MKRQAAAKPDLAKAYDASKVEDAIYRRWEASGYFNPDKLPGAKTRKPFTVMMPPPNRTGILHVGHATGIAIQDLLIRFNRMRGRKALWLPGTDHAAIATQVKVEGLLREKGMKDPRRELGREKFLKEVVKFAGQSGKTIVRQTRKMGASCDWSREAYTFDAPRNHAVNELFRMMHEDGLIERGQRVVNWDPQFRTTLSDDEVQMKETKAKLLTFRYDKSFPIAISTTRPETKFGDTAVAVHPDDARYKEYVGKTFAPIFCSKRLTIKIIADKAVDPKFGTGALGVTPAHSMIDAEMAERHGLPMVQVIGPDARLTTEAGAAFAGLTVVEARAKIERLLAEAGVLERVEEIPQNLPVAERGGAPVEQLPMLQWFVRVGKPFTLRQATLGKWKKGEKATLKQLMRAAVASGQIKILPAQFEKIYFHWIDNLRDWCISRQIWFGHRVPVWYKGDALRVSEKSPGKGWAQDPDTLDTWFSAGAWTFSALGWPGGFKGGRKTGDLKTFHPTDVLETGRDILFFWVARMVLMSAYALGEVPFKTVYLHGLVRDEQGRKMSKSLGNIIDPLDVAAKYGTDAVRLSLVIGNAPGADTRLSEEKIASFRNFTNKLWNISRFVLASVSKVRRVRKKPIPKTLADRWILSESEWVAGQVSDQIQAYEFSSAGERLREFTWTEFADWYLEIAKIQMQNAKFKATTETILLYVLENVLKLWHPFMPFVTEAIWDILASNTDGKHSLMVETWPLTRKMFDAAHPAKLGEFGRIKEIVSEIRRIRSNYKVEPAKRIDAYVSATGSVPRFLKENIEIIQALARLSKFDILPKGAKTQDMAPTVAGGVEIFLPLSGMVDPAKEKARLDKEKTELEGVIGNLDAKLANPGYIEKAPKDVVEKTRQMLKEKQEALEKVQKALSGIA